MTDQDVIASRLIIELGKCEASVHVRTLKGGYADAIVIGQEVYDAFIPEIKKRLKERFDDKIVLKPKMYKPMIRYVWFGDNEHFRESDEEYYGVSQITQEIELDTPIQDEERIVEYDRDYFIEDLDDPIIKALLEDER